MQPKQSEADFAALMGRQRVWCHKFRDVMYCPNCHRPVFMTNHSQAQDKESQQSIVDYLIYVGIHGTWVECKQAEKAFEFRDLVKRQREFLSSWNDRQLVTWFFLLMTSGPIPGHREEKQAYLIPWATWLKIEDEFRTGTDKIKGRLSLPFFSPSLQLTFSDMRDQHGLSSYALAWTPTVGWTIPASHAWNTIYPYAYDLPELFKKE